MACAFDFHIHSKYSFDSTLEPYKILEIAKRKGLSGIAITDHNTIKGGLEAKRLNEDKDFSVVVGSEICTEIGDIVGLFLSEEVKSRNSEDVIEEIRSQGGIVVLPHPFKYHRGINKVLKKINLIESFNARADKKANLLAHQLAIKNKIPMIGGSDAHFLSEIGLGKTIFDDFTDAGDVKKNLLCNKRKIEGRYSSKYSEIISDAIKSINTDKAYKLVFVPYRLIKAFFGR
ncbi:Error-prone DNA polymerase [uncultured archaeon]|nr:Error-prone DNA polymerase [uncultured archaeon]